VFGEKGEAVANAELAEVEVEVAGEGMVKVRDGMVWISPGYSKVSLEASKTDRAFGLAGLVLARFIF
jgi:hypothetical protein